MQKFDGKSLKQAREVRGWSHQNLVYALANEGVSITTMSLRNYETGKTVPDSDLLMAVATVLGKNLEFFFAHGIRQTP